jgi:phage terminase small subunit
MSEKKKLTDKQEAFCREYIVDFNATQAAIRAGYSEKTAKDIGCQNLAKLNISEKIAELSSKVVQKHDVTIERIIQEYANIAFLDPIEVFNKDGCLKPLSEMSEPARRALSGIKIRSVGGEVEADITEVKIIDKRQALADLGKHLGMFIERVDHTTKGKEITGIVREIIDVKAKD